MRKGVRGMRRERANGYRAGMGSKQVLEMRQLVFLWFRPPTAWDYVAIFKCSCINY